jgi:integrase
MVLQECPICKFRQKLANKKCKCGESLGKAKRSRRIRYWIKYRVPGSKKQWWQPIGLFLKEAQDADAKRKVQKRENRIFDMIPMADYTFTQLLKWYMELESVKRLAMFNVVGIHAAHFNKEFGERKVTQLKATEVGNFQAKLKRQGYAPSYIDQIIATVKTAVNAAFNDDLIPGDCLKPFLKTKKLLKKGANAREVVISHSLYQKMLQAMPAHLQPIFAMGYWTGMREGEILRLSWDRLDLARGWVYLDQMDTKDEARRRIPLHPELIKILKRIPRAVHTNFVFLFQGDKLKKISAGVKSGCRKAGVPYGRFTPGGFVFHDLRHTYVTNMKRAGVENKVVMAMTGHADEKMMNHYWLVDESDAKEAIDRLTAYLAKG